MRKRKSQSTTALKNIRRARTLNQTVLARLLRVSQQTYSKYESGVLVPPSDVQARLAAILGTSVDALFPTTGGEANA